MVRKNGVLVQSSIDGAVGSVTLNRPERMNAFNLDLARQFIRAVDDFGNNRDIRAIVIRGAGPLFSAGGDVKEMLGNVESGDRAAYFREPLSAFNGMVMAVRRAAKPVLAAVHGAAAGVAFNLMIACDLKIAVKGTRFAQAFVKLGVSPDGGGTYFLPRIVGYARACELCMLPTELDAETALAWGLINRIVSEQDFPGEVKNFADRLAAGPTMALGRAKALFNAAYDRPLADQMESERLAQVENAATEDFEEGLRAFVGKRPPSFMGR